MSTRLEDPGKFPMAGPASTFEQWYDNRGSLEQKSVFSRKHSTEDSWELKFTESFKYGITTEASFSLFNTAGVKVTESFEISLSSTQTVASKETKTWEIQQIITIPAQKSVLAKFIVQADKYQDFYFISETQISGHVGIWFNNKIDINAEPGKGKDFHWLWFIPVNTIVNEVKARKANYYTSGGYSYVKARGKINGVRGLKSYVTIEEYDVRRNVGETNFLE